MSENRTELSDLGEFGLIDRIQKQFPIRNATSLTGIGDDAARVVRGGRQHGQQRRNIMPIDKADIKAKGAVFVVQRVKARGFLGPGTLLQAVAVDDQGQVG